MLQYLVSELEYKENLLCTTVALPSKKELQIQSEGDPATVSKVYLEICEILQTQLAALKTIHIDPDTVVKGDLYENVFGQLLNLQKKTGIDTLNDKLRERVAVFFGINYHPSLYHYMRWEDGAER